VLRDQPRQTFGVLTFYLALNFGQILDQIAAEDDQKLAADTASGLRHLSDEELAGHLDGTLPTTRDPWPVSPAVDEMMEQGYCDIDAVHQNINSAMLDRRQLPVAMDQELPEEEAPLPEMDALQGEEILPAPQPPVQYNPPQRTANRLPSSAGTRPPVNVQSPSNIPMSMVEIATFFPNWFQIPKLAARCLQSQWRYRSLAKAQLNATNNLTRANEKPTIDRVKNQFVQGVAEFYSLQGAVSFSVIRANHKDAWDNDASSAGWTLPANTNLVFQHMALKDIYDHVDRSRWPVAEDRLVLTKCFEFAADHEDLDLDTSHYDWIIQVNGWEIPVVDTKHDDLAQRRVNRRIEDPKS
jgi:hypothetical protein